MRRSPRAMRPVDPISRAASFVVYAGLAIFTLGMGYRIYQWLQTPKSEIDLALYPKPDAGAGLITKVATDTLIAPQSREIEPVMWAAAFAWHAAALAAFVGHLGLVGGLSPFEKLFGRERFNRFGGTAGGIAGAVMTVGSLFWLNRRFKEPYKDISVPEDYALLLLLLGVELTGEHMRLRGDVHSESYRGWFRRTLAFKPAFPAELAESPSRWSLDAHMFTVGALLAYFPWSKLVHVIGAFLSNRVRSD